MYVGRMNRCLKTNKNIFQTQNINRIEELRKKFDIKFNNKNILVFETTKMLD